jgi:3-hydroxyisobutyrate dehydrogenase-like beta-hydroxyacid dehydrogenase
LASSSASAPTSSPSFSLRAGVVGLGDIGRGVAENIVRAGIGLTVCDVREEATSAFSNRARIAADPADLAATSDVVLVSVMDDAQVLGVLEGPAGAFSGMAPGSTVVVLSTVSPETVLEVDRVAKERGAAVLDCGVSGGPLAAAEGTLVGMLGGDDAVVDGVRPVLEAFCSLVVRMGPLGAGLRAKLARNLVQYGSWLAAYEAQRLAEAGGIELGKLAKVIRISDEKIGGASRLMFRPSVAPFGEDDDQGVVAVMRAAASLAHKDLCAALELAEQLGVNLPLAQMTEARTDAMFGIAPDVFAEAERGGREVKRSPPEP